MLLSDKRLFIEIEWVEEEEEAGVGVSVRDENGGLRWREREEDEGKGRGVVAMTPWERGRERGTGHP